MVANDCSVTFVSSVGEEPATSPTLTEFRVSNPVLTLACGGDGGSPFHSGINSSGVVKVVVEVGSCDWFSSTYRSQRPSPHVLVVNRFHLTFFDGANPTESIYRGYAVDHHKKNILCEYAVPHGNNISSIDIWSDEFYVKLFS